MISSSLPNSSSSPMPFKAIFFAFLVVVALSAMMPAAAAATTRESMSSVTAATASSTIYINGSASDVRSNTWDGTCDSSSPTPRCTLSSPCLFHSLTEMAIDACHIVLTEAVPVPLNSAITLVYNGGEVRMSSMKKVSFNSLTIQAPQGSFVFSNMSTNYVGLTLNVSTFQVLDSNIRTSQSWTWAVVPSTINIFNSTITSGANDVWNSGRSPSLAPVHVTIENSAFIPTNFYTPTLAFSSSFGGSLTMRNVSLSQWGIETNLTDHYLSGVNWQFISPAAIRLLGRIGSLQVENSVIWTMSSSSIGSLVSASADIETLQISDSSFSYATITRGTANNAEQISLRNVTYQEILSGSETFLYIASNSTSTSLSCTVVDCYFQSAHDILTLRSQETIPFDLQVSSTTVFETIAHGLSVSGWINFPTPFNSSTLALAGTTTVTGPSIELLGLVASGFTLHLNTSTASLHPFSNLLTSVVVSPSTVMLYVPTDTVLGLELLSLQTTRFGLDWRSSALPPVSIPFLLATNSPNGITYYDYQQTNEYDITTSWESATGSTLFTFNTVPCNAHCAPSHLASTDCSSRLKCVCQAPWAGEFCECDQTGILSGAVCEARGAIWNYTGDLTLPMASVSTIPINHTLSIDGGLNLGGNLTLQDGSLQVSGQANFDGRLKFTSTLYEVRQGAGCIINSTPNVAILQTLRVANTGIVDIELDVSQLSTDQSCVPPTDSSMNGLAKPLVAVLGAVSIDSASTWNIKFVGGTSQNLSFTTDLLLSGNLAASAGNLANIHLDVGTVDACSRVELPQAGKMTLRVGCATPVPTDSSTIPTGNSSQLWVSWSLILLGLAFLVV